MEQMKPLGGNNERVWDVFFANTDLPTSVQKKPKKTPLQGFKDGS